MILLNVYSWINISLVQVEIRCQVSTRRLILFARNFLFFRDLSHLFKLDACDIQIYKSYPFYNNFDDPRLVVQRSYPGKCIARVTSNSIFFEYPTESKFSDSSLCPA